MDASPHNKYQIPLLTSALVVLELDLPGAASAAR